MTVPPSPTASLSDILTTAKNLVLAVNAATQNYMNVQGLLNYPGISAPTIVKAISGRLATVSIVTAGSTPGTIYDGATLTATTRPLATVPNTVGVFTCPMPVSYGILVVPGTGQVISVGYS
jgi:hypothetical protein